jgi:hypothetical protein
MTDEKLKAYGKSEQGNFEAIDTIGVPHPYVITPHHVGVASDNFCGMLGKEAIEECERRGHGCGMKINGEYCRLSFAQHEQAVLVGCSAELKDTAGKINPELHAWLLKIKDQAEKDGFAGFAFKKV